MSVRTVQIGECAKVINGFAFKSGLFSTERRGLPVVRIRDVIRGCSETYYIGDYPNSAVIQNGDLLIGMDGEFNIAQWQGGRALLNQRVCKIEALNGKSDLSYLRYALPVILKRIEDRTPFVTVKHLSSEELKDEPIPLPELSEQQRIAGQLAQADRLRRTRRYALELSDSFFPAAFLELFGDPATNPFGFPMEEVESVFLKQRGGAKCGPFGSALKSHEYVSEGIPVWTMENVGENEFREDGCLYITPEKFEGLKAYDAQNGDILISRAGTVGRMAIVETKYPRSIIHSNIIRLSLDPSRCLPIYFTVLMTFFAERVGRLKRGQEDAYSFMNTSRLAELRIPIPPPALQQQFAALAARHERLRATQREALRQAEHLFQTLLHRAFSEGGGSLNEQVAVPF